MPNVLYVGLQDADKIAVFAIEEAGKLTKQGEVPAHGGPSVMAVAPDRPINAPDDVVPAPTRSGVRTAALQ